MNSIATMMNKLRTKLNSFGLTTANGWYITKHGAAIYSSKPFVGDWNQVADTTNLQNSIDNQEKPNFIETPEGEATVETYTVVHSRNGPDQGIVIGRLDDGKRFIANTEKDPKILQLMSHEEMLNKRGYVSRDGKRNIFKPNL